MALNAYISAVRTLLHDPNAQFFTTATLTTFINEARQQIASEGECVRAVPGFSTVALQETYSNSVVSGPTPDIGALLAIRAISYGGLTLEARPWDYFNFYMRNLAKPLPGPPKAWSPFSTGTNGIFFISPLPADIYNIELDAIWLPINLAADGDPEALPYPWTDAVQFYAAYLALKDSQRTSDAERMFALYEDYMLRARGGVVPYPAPSTYPGGIAARSNMPGTSQANRSPIGTQPQPKG